MNHVPFTAKIRFSNGIYVVTVPKAYLDNGLLREDCDYNFTAKEVQE
jgi:hypothetical protein